jgi:hypothetical protein
MSQRRLRRSFSIQIRSWGRELGTEVKLARIALDHVLERVVGGDRHGDALVHGHHVHLDRGQIGADLDRGSAGVGADRLQDRSLDGLAAQL